MTMKSIRSIFRRVQGTNKSEQSGDDLSRSSSITNINAESKNKGALSKSKKSASKDRLDKIADKKNDKKALTRNNNKIDDPSSYATESLQEIESLQRQLQEMANEKTSLALQLGEQKGHMHAIENEMLSLKKMHEQLNQENNLLRSRLKDVAHSPLSDNEKQQLLLESHRHHSSAPASIATNLIEDGAGGDITACTTPDWDKHSSSNVSEISVACLQDRINQMEETHYSTKEELQATVQELNDLQRQLTELQQDNYQLLEDKNLMFDSLCRQTERLNESKSEIENLKQRLREKEDDTGQYESAVEREQNLVALVKNAQEEREVLLLKQEQLANEIQEAIANNSQQVALVEQLNERIKTLESALDAKNAEHRQLDQELTLVKDQSSGMQIEIDRLTDVLENARTKIIELEQDRALSDKSELDELLDNARKEKDALESEVTHLKEQIARSKNESEKLKDQVSILQEECKVTRNNAKCTQSELEYKCEILMADKNNLNEQLQQIQEAANSLQVQAQCQLEDKRQLSSVLSETQKLLSEAERRIVDLETEIADLKRLRKDENEEWEKFQNDLLTSVRVANDFKTEAQHDLQKMIMENKAHREKVRHLEAQIDKLRDTGGGEEDDKVIAVAHRERKEDEVEYQEVQYQEINTPTKEDILVGTEQDKSEILPSERGSEEVVIRNTNIPKAKSLQNIATETDRASSTEPKLKSSGSFEETVLNSDQSFREGEDIDDDKELQKSKLKPPSSKSFFKKPKIFRNQKGYYVSGPTSLDYQDVNATSSQDSLPYENAAVSLPPVVSTVLIPPAQEKLEQPPPEMDVKDNKPKKIFGLISSKQKSEPVPTKIESKKHLSSQEQKDLHELNSLYANIDPNIPEEFLTPEQKFIVQLKKTYNSTFERKKSKPVANKPKGTLAISKPLLTSVISNPKLKQIADDPTVRLVEDDTTKNLYNTSNVFYPAAQSSSISRRFDDIHASSIQFSYYDAEDGRNTVETFKANGTLPKSKSLNDLYFQNEELLKMSNYDLNRQHSEGSLTNFASPTGRPSMLNTTVRVESYASTFSDSEASDAASLAKQNIYNKEYKETLTELCKNIDPNLSESDLTNEQRYVRNMRISMEEMGMKQTLRKENKRNLKISEPTRESVWSNPKLASVIKDTNMPPVKAEQKENKFKKLFEKFKSKKNEPPKKVIVAKQISQEDIVRVTNPIEIDNIEKDILFKNRSESDLTKQRLVEENVKASESTSSLFKSVIGNSNLQKLIENRESPKLGKASYEYEDDSSVNSEMYRPKEDFSTPKKHTSPSAATNTDHYLSDTTSSAGSSRKETIHRISSIPPAETFNTFVKMKISPNTQKITFDYDELVESSSKDTKGNLKISIGLDSFDVDQKVIKSVERDTSEDTTDKSKTSTTLISSTEGVFLGTNPGETESYPYQIEEELEEYSDHEVRPTASFRKPKPDQEYIEKVYKNRLSGFYDHQVSTQSDQVGLNQLLEQPSDAKKSPLYIKHSPKYKKQISVPTRPPPPPPTAAARRHLSVVEDDQSEKVRSPESKISSLEDEHPLFNTSFKFYEPIVAEGSKNEKTDDTKLSKPQYNEDDEGRSKGTIFDLKFNFEEPIISTNKIDENPLKDVEFAERLIREINNDSELKNDDDPIYFKFNFEDLPVNETEDQKGKKANFEQEDSIFQKPQTDDLKGPFLDVKFNFNEPFTENKNVQSPENLEIEESTIRKPQTDDLRNSFLDVKFSFNEPFREDEFEVSASAIETNEDGSNDYDDNSFDVESVEEDKYHRRIGIISSTMPPVQMLNDVLDDNLSDRVPLKKISKKIEEYNNQQNVIDEEPIHETQNMANQVKFLPDEINETALEQISPEDTKDQPNLEDTPPIKVDEFMYTTINQEEENISPETKTIELLKEEDSEIKTKNNAESYHEDAFELIQPPDMFSNDNKIFSDFHKNPEENESSISQSVLETEDSKRDSFTSSYFINFKSKEINSCSKFLAEEIKFSSENLKPLTHTESDLEDTLKESDIQTKDPGHLPEDELGTSLDLSDKDLGVEGEKSVSDIMKVEEKLKIITPVEEYGEIISDEPEIKVENSQFAQQSLGSENLKIIVNEPVLDSILLTDKMEGHRKPSLQSENPKLEEDESKLKFAAAVDVNEIDLDKCIETVPIPKDQEKEEIQYEEIQDLKLPSPGVNSDIGLSNSGDSTDNFIETESVQDVKNNEFETISNHDILNGAIKLKDVNDHIEENPIVGEVTSGSLTIHKDEVEIKQFSYTLQISEREVDQFGEIERESVQSSTSFSTEIDDSDPNFGSIINTKSKHSRQSSTSSEEEVFRRLSYKLDKSELSFLRDVYRKYEVERAKSPINDGDIALIERAKLNSLSPNFEDNGRISETEVLDNDVFLENNKGTEDQGDDDELTEMELALIRKIQHNREDRPISDINEKDLKIITTIRQESLTRKRSRGSDIKFEDISVDISDDLAQQSDLTISSEKDELDVDKPDESLEDDELTEMELELIRRIQRNSEERPISNINEHDLRIIATARQESFSRKLSRGSDVKLADASMAVTDNLTQQENSAQELVKEDSLQNYHINANIEETVVDIAQSHSLEDKVNPKFSDSKLSPNKNPTNIPTEEIIDAMKTSSTQKENLINSSSMIEKDQTSKGETTGSEDLKITAKNNVITKPLKPTQKKRNVKGFSSSSFIESLLDDNASMSDSAKAFMKKPARRKPGGKSKITQPVPLNNPDTLLKDITRDSSLQNEDSESAKINAEDVVDNIAEKTSFNEKTNEESELEVTKHATNDTTIEGNIRNDKTNNDFSREGILPHVNNEEPIKIVNPITDDTNILNICDTTRTEEAHQLKPLQVSDDILSKNSVSNDDVEEFSNKIFANYSTSSAFTRTNSLSRRTGSEFSSGNLVKINSNNLARSKSVESPFLQFKNEAKISFSNVKDEKPVKTVSTRKEQAFTYVLDTSKVYEPIYANYIELQKPKRPSFTRITKPPVPSPRYEHPSRHADKIDSKQNAFDSSRNIIMADKGLERTPSPISITAEVRDKHQFTQLDIRHSKDDTKVDTNNTDNTDNSGTSSGAKPKKAESKKSTTKMANNLILKTSSMDILYDSEESAGISEKSSLDKSYLDLFRSPEQVVYDNLSEPEKSKATFTTIHFIKSGDISSESSNPSAQDVSSNKVPNKVSHLRKKFEQGKKQTVVEESAADNEEILPAVDSQSVTANHVLKNVPKASNLPQNIKEFVKEEKQQSTLSSANSSLENLRKTARKSFENARSVFELKVKKQGASEEKICETSGNTNENNNVEGSNHQAIP